MIRFFKVVSLIVDLLLSPFRNLPPVLGIAFLSLLTAIFILLVYKAVSNQEAIVRWKKRIQGHFLGIYLFRDDAGQILKSLSSLCLAILAYLGHSVRPLLIIIIPVLLLCVQMQLRYGYRSLQPGEEVLISLKMAPEAESPLPPPELKTPPEVIVQTEPVRIPSLREITWRIKVGKEGNYPLSFTTGGIKAETWLKASPRIERVYPATGRASLMNILTYPGQKLLPPQGPIISLEIAYPRRTIGLLGLRLHWAIVYFALTLVFSLVLKRPLSIEF